MERTGHWVHSCRWPFLLRPSGGAPSSLLPLHFKGPRNVSPLTGRANQTLLLWPGVLAAPVSSRDWIIASWVIRQCFKNDVIALHHILQNLLAVYLFTLHTSWSCTALTYGTGDEIVIILLITCVKHCMSSQARMRFSRTGDFLFNLYLLQIWTVLSWLINFYWTHFLIKLKYSFMLRKSECLVPERFWVFFYPPQGCRNVTECVITCHQSSI